MGKVGNEGQQTHQNLPIRSPQNVPYHNPFCVASTPDLSTQTWSFPFPALPSAAVFTPFLVSMDTREGCCGLPTPAIGYRWRERSLSLSGIVSVLFSPLGLTIPLVEEAGVTPHQGPHQIVRHVGHGCYRTCLLAALPVAVAHPCSRRFHSCFSASGFPKNEALSNSGIPGSCPHPTCVTHTAHTSTARGKQLAAEPQGG